MMESKVKRISFIDDKENKLKSEILKKYVIVTSGGKINIEDTDVAEICIFNGGACLITFVGKGEEQEIDSSSLDIPSGVGFISSYVKCREFLSDIDYIATSEVETQKVVQIYPDGKTATAMTAIIKYYKAENPENAWKLFDDSGTLV